MYDERFTRLDMYELLLLTTIQTLMMISVLHGKTLVHFEKSKNPKTIVHYLPLGDVNSLRLL